MTWQWTKFFKQVKWLEGVKMWIALHNRVFHSALFCSVSSSMDLSWNSRTSWKFKKLNNLVHSFSPQPKLLRERLKDCFSGVGRLRWSLVKWEILEYERRERQATNPIFTVYSPDKKKTILLARHIFKLSEDLWNFFTAICFLSFLWFSEECTLLIPQH